MKTDRASFTLVFFLTLVGLSVRISSPLSASFPLNDGGLFYKMILDLQANHFALPSYTSYNNAAIPFAYPPLAFYLYGWISSIGHIPLLKLMQILPAVVSALTIPAFYLLAKEILDSKTQAALALLAFAFVPRAFDWLIMGGGVTRSLGLLFALLAMRQAYLLFSIKSDRAIPAMILLGALVVYTHPEAATHAVISAIFFYLWKDRSIKGLSRAMIAARGILLITAPWWLTIVTRHGLDPFLASISAAKQNSYNILVGILILFRFDFTDEPSLTLVAVLAIIGLFTLLSRRKFFIVFWFLLMHTLEPRGGSLFMMIPMAMFAGVGLDQTVLPGLRELNREPLQSLKKITNDEDWTSRAFEGRYVKIFLVVLFIYTSLFAFQTAAKIKQHSTLTKVDLAAFKWVKENTPPNSQFVLLTQGLSLNDSSSEWFPAITERKSIATVFGYEWINDGNFSVRLDTYQKLQECAVQDITCLNRWAQETGRDFSHIYIRKTQGAITSQTSLSVYLSNSPEFENIYETADVVVFSKR
ncbi:MAG: hypothetical protein HY863_07285 [Chloroflexi bacterium]|nr:hypothetical protein [Chloroflexota bacterium]